MEPVILLMLIGAGSATAVWAFNRRARQQFVTSVRTEWVRAGRIVHYGPVLAAAYGSRPESVYWKWHFGALGLTDGTLTFIGHRGDTYNTSVPFEDVRAIQLYRITIHAGKATVKKEALVIHAEQNDHWNVYTFTAEKKQADFARELGRLSGQRVQDIPYGRDDHGPTSATRMRQDIYGQWEAERTAELYLAPDRLVFGWRTAVFLNQIRRLDVLPRSGVLAAINPFGEDLLRVEYQGADGSPQTAGFVLRGAEGWGDAIASRTRVPLNIHAGRKKKDE
jgi:hypothetical protein